MTTPEIHSQQQRENPEPQEGANPMPWFVLLLTAALLGFGVVYIARSAIGNAPALGDGRTPAELQGAAPVAAGAVVDGAAVYATRCVACHQATGAGLPGVFPPLVGSEWVLGKDTTLASIVLHGISGPLTVKGSVYNGAMPAFKVQLQDAELAAVLSHIRSHWGNGGAAITPDVVANARQTTSARTEPFNGDAELAALK